MLRQERQISLRNDERGITLVELLVSVAILAVILVPCLSVFVTSARISARTRESSTAESYASSILEEMRGMSLADIEDEFRGTEVSAGPDGSRSDYMYFTEYPLDNNEYIGKRKVKSMKAYIAIDRVSGPDTAENASESGITAPVLYRVNVTLYDRNVQYNTLKDAKKRADLTMEMVK